MRAFFFFFLLRELKLVKVIQSSAARYVRAGLFLRVEKTEREKKKKVFKCVFVCACGRVSCVCTVREGWRKRGR